MEMIGKCLAGHHLDASGKRKTVEPKYDNPMRDWILLLIAEKKAEQSLKNSQTGKEIALAE